MGQVAWSSHCSHYSWALPCATCAHRVVAEASHNLLCYKQCIVMMVLIGGCFAVAKQLITQADQNTLHSPCYEQFMTVHIQITGCFPFTQQLIAEAQQHESIIRCLLRAVHHNRYTNLYLLLART